MTSHILDYISDSQTANIPLFFKMDGVMDALRLSREKDKREINKERRSREILMTSAVTVSPNGRKEFLTENRTMERGINHIVQNHMLPTQCQGKSYFLSNNRSYVSAIVERTMKRPDTTSPHNYKRDRGVKRRRFASQIGVHGTSKTPCYCVTVIFSVKTNEIITAFPTV